MAEKYLVSVRNQFSYYKSVADKAILQLTDEQLFWKPNKQSNSAADLLRHISGNLLSRWTDFLTSDGEKEWRDRDLEFECDEGISRLELENEWERGWRVLYSTIDQLNEDDLEKTVYIRKEPQLVVQAINRALAHYSYHVGQLVYIAKSILDDKWVTISIPKGQSRAYNREKGM